MIKSIKLSNLLSFGKDSQEVELLPLNIIIGANGCGKSNFLEAFDLLKNAPSSIMKPIREGGGVSDWVYKGSHSEGTQLTRLKNNQLKAWLDTYRLGELWTRGDIGGTRW